MKVKEGRDYYIDNGKYVWTEAFLRERGFCCECGCRHCPWGFKKPRAVSSGAERLTYIQEVTGANPVPPTQ